MSFTAVESILAIKASPSLGGNLRFLTVRSHCTSLDVGLHSGHITWLAFRSDRYLSPAVAYWIIKSNKEF